MSVEKKRARPSVGAPGRAEAGVNHADGNSHHKHITQALGGQWGIADLLLPGRENAIPRRERREGRPILADNAIPATEYERAACVRHRADETAEAIDRAGV